MKQKVVSLFSICLWRSKVRKLRTEKGFLLGELQITVAVMALVTALLYGDFYQLVQGWHKMFIDVQLRDASRYMYSILEKDLCYEGKLLTLSDDYRGNAKLLCQTGHAGKTYTYTWEGKSLYKTTKTTNTSGKNPLFVPDCSVVEWQVQKLNDKFLLIKFALEKQGRRQNFEQVMHCFNGSVVYE